ncbi:hypothetical protein ACFZAM_14465 [Streptomyces sp. NPDC008079]|uniref:hypothetical protein n=1 Tax=Streptomyces sp. NPDC008079 TaxID=3364806 RepID=UPI0036F0F83B
MAVPRELRRSAWISTPYAPSSPSPTRHGSSRHATDPHSLVWRADNPHPALTVLRRHLRGTAPDGRASDTWTPKWTHPPVARSARPGQEPRRAGPAGDAVRPGAG